LTDRANKRKESQVAEEKKKTDKWWETSEFAVVLLGIVVVIVVFLFWVGTFINLGKGSPSTHAGFMAGSEHRSGFLYFRIYNSWDFRAVSFYDDWCDGTLDYLVAEDKGEAPAKVYYSWSNPQPNVPGVRNPVYIYCNDEQWGIWLQRFSETRRDSVSPRKDD